jgi:hypothetical protein
MARNKDKRPDANLSLERTQKKSLISRWDWAGAQSLHDGISQEILSLFSSSANHHARSAKLHISELILWDLLGDYGEMDDESHNLFRITREPISVLSHPLGDALVEGNSPPRRKQTICTIPNTFFYKIAFLLHCTFYLIPALYFLIWSLYQDTIYKIYRYCLCLSAPKAK